MFGRRLKLSIAIVLFFTINLINSKPTSSLFDVGVEIDETSDNEISLDQNQNKTNSTRKELYVIREVVYEVGILVDTNDTDSSEIDDSSDSGEVVNDQVQLTIFGSSNNGTLDFGDIPLPVKKVNGTGHVMTGLEPLHIGQITNLTALAESLPFNGTIVNVTKTEGTFLVLDKLNTSNVDMNLGNPIDESVFDRFSEIHENLPPIGAAAPDL